MARVSLLGVWKRFDGGVVAVRDVNLEVEDGEFVVLVGPSGCGKTTVLRMIAGLETISEGEVRIGDRLVNHVRPSERDIAMVFQSYALYPHMRVHQNMSFGLRLRKVAEAVIGKRVRGTADVLGVTPLLERRPHQLSGGQRQRVALGRAMVREPAAFLMDEPLSNLDAKLRVHMRAELSRLHRRLGTTTIYVTHDQAEAMTMGDRIVAMRDGLVQQIGTPETIYQRPANRFVAGFVGTPSMSFLDGVFAGDPEGLAVDLGGFRVRLLPERAARLGERARSGAPVVLGVRPEDVFDPRFRVAEAAIELVEGEVEVREAMGPETYLHVNVGAQTLVARVDPRCAARVGERVTLALDRARCHLFDAETEAALP